MSLDLRSHISLMESSVTVPERQRPDSGIVTVATAVPGQGYLSSPSDQRAEMERVSQTLKKQSKQKPYSKASHVVPRSDNRRPRAVTTGKKYYGVPSVEQFTLTKPGTLSYDDNTIFDIEGVEEKLNSAKVDIDSAVDDAVQLSLEHNAVSNHYVDMSDSPASETESAFDEEGETAHEYTYVVG